MADVTSAFEAKSLSVYDLFSKPGQFFYIPSYQRKYSWGKERITSLLNDILQGFNRLLDDKEAYTFLGSIITVSNIGDESIFPLVKEHKPSQVISIIDGQQRTTTLLVINIALHNLLIEKYVPFTKNEFETEHENISEWLADRHSQIIKKLAQIFEEDQNYDRDKTFSYYPKMIRAFDDCWSKRQKDAEYKSPIGFLLHNYGIHSRLDTEKFKPFNNSEDHKTIEALKIIRNLLNKNIEYSANYDALETDTISDFDDFPLFSKLQSNLELQDLLLRSEFPAYLHDYLNNGKHKQKLREFLTTLMLTNYFIDYVALTIVAAKDEKYAFDIFESLNTTGEPLTAFETFKPKVIQDIGIGTYYNGTSALKVYLEDIETVLEKSNKEQIKKSLTSDLIIAYASLWSHEKMSKKLSDQRQFFRLNYDYLAAGTECTDLRFKFVKYMALTNEFIDQIWSGEAVSYKNTYLDFDRKIDDQTRIALAFLNELKHTIVIPVLARFYINFSLNLVQNSDIEIDKMQSIQEFENAVKAVAAFSIIWRSSRKGTEGIDQVYRHLMSTSLEVYSFNALSIKEPNSISSISLKKALIHYLARSKSTPIASKEDWINRISKLAIYKEPAALSRILLLAVSHDSIPSSNGDFIKSARSNINPFLTYEKWTDINLKTIEHISPQNPDASDKNNITLENEDDIHCLGNLTLLPASANSIVSNRNWSTKHKIFKYLLTKEPNECSVLKSQLEAEKLTSSQLNTLEKMDYLPILQSIINIQFDDKITSKAIEESTKKIADLAYSELSKWLDDL